MKKVGKLLFMVCMFFAMSTTTLAADAKASMSNAEAGHTEKVYLTVSLDDCDKANTLGITIKYDSSVLKKVTSDCTWEKTGVLQDFDVSSNNGVWATKKATDLNGEICTLAFQVKPNAPEGSTKVTCEVTVKKDSKLIGTYAAEGTVTVNTTEQKEDMEGDQETDAPDKSEDGENSNDSTVSNKPDKGNDSDKPSSTKKEEQGGGIIKWFTSKLEAIGGKKEKTSTKREEKITSDIVEDEIDEQEHFQSEETYNEDVNNRNIEEDEHGHVHVESEQEEKDNVAVYLVICLIIVILAISIFAYKKMGKK